ncbi:MAG: AAA family ATPase [Deltaproteobacteria bacterium]|nr:AAA family ATPase [Deltaproteobacteria bacterium]
MGTEKAKLTLDQEQALYHLNHQERRNIFLTGGAGTGKSFLIQHFLRSTTEKIPVLASTGAAAILIGGRTFHSFFGLGLMQGGPQLTFEKALTNKRLKKRLKSVSTLIIDEVSMLSHETLDCAEAIARALRTVDMPWGGIRIIAIGDFAQLPPVSRAMPEEFGGYRANTKPWAFLGEAWASSGFKRLILEEVMRTGDQDFLKVLEDLRWGNLSVRLKHFLENQTCEYVDEDVTHLFPRRNQTDKYNLGRLADLSSESRKYETIYSGESRYFDQLKRDAPVSEVLELKKGAHVMIRVNDPRQRYVNGTTGTVVALKDDVITVDTANRRIDIEPFVFGVQDADGNEVAFAKNFPLSLAYASTIHKIQGATLDRLHVDLASLWEPGQAYVALSRARRGKDVTIMRWSPSSIRSDEMVKEFYSGSDKVTKKENLYETEFQDQSI